METYNTIWVHDITNKVINITVNAISKSSGALKTVREIENQGHNLDLWTCIKTI